MNAKQAIPLVAAVGLGLVAMKIAHDMSAKKTAAPAAVHSVQVVVARGPVSPGAAFTADQLELQKIPGEVPPEKSITSIDEVVGRVALVPVFDGQPLRQDFLCPKGTPAGLSSLVPAGMRAITIDVNETSSVAGLLVPGSRVDVLSTVATNDTNKPAARTVVQNVPILAVGQRLSPAKPEGDKPDNGYRTVTLLVNPHDAQLIDLASTASRTRLILRGINDDTKVESDPVTFVELLGHQGDSAAAVQPIPAILSAPATQPAMPTIHHVTQVIKGGTVNNVDFELSTPDPASMTDSDGPAAIEQ